MKADLILLLSALVAGCSATTSTSAASSKTKREPPPTINLAPDVTVRRLEDGVWLHTSYKNLPQWGPFPSNGLIVLDGESTILVDTAWTNAQTQTLLSWVDSTLKRPVTHAVMTHAHDDKMGGVAVLKARGILTYAHVLSNRVAPSRGLTPAEHDLDLQVGDTHRLGRVTVLYPGPGHTVDNIVVSVPPRIVFGGCLIRPGATKSLGNTADAVVEQWADTVLRVAGRFADAQLVVPSHGPPGGRRLFDHTAQLARNYRARPK